jgi:bacterioferritin-associated ferredoxin
MECHGSIESLNITDSYICSCIKVTHADLLAAVARHEIRTLKDLCRYTGAGDACMACHRRLRRYVGVGRPRGLAMPPLPEANDIRRLKMKPSVSFVTAVSVVLLAAVHAQEPQKFGAGVSLTEATPIARVLERPSDFEGRTIRVEGTVTAVCAHMGCWMAFAPDRTPDDRTLLVKVDDGVIVFPLSAKGRRAVAQGVIQRVGTNDPEAQEAAAEHARHTGSSGAEVRTSWPLKATGALLY